MGWLSGYNYRRKLTVDSTEIDGSLSDFPVLVKLDNSNFDYSKTKTDGTDIRFTSDDETTLLKYEREVYDFGYDAETKLLLHCDGTDTSTSFPDATGKHSPTAVGNAQVDTAQKVFGTGSLLCDGSGDYLSVPNSSNFNFQSEDFTIECRVRFLSTAGNQGLFGIETSGGSYFYIAWESGNKIRFRDYGGTYDSSFGWTASAGQWYHFAITRSGNNIRCFIDGTQIGTTAVFSGAFIDRVNPLFVGTSFSTGYFLNGWMDEVRISKGVARWTTNFTPPTSAYVEDTVQGDFHVKVPTVAEGNVGACDFPDNAKLSVPNHADWTFGTGKFTIDCWVYFDALTQYDCIFSPYDDGSNNRCMLDIGANNNLNFGAGSGGTTIASFKTPNDSLSTGQWTHIALVRDGANEYIFIDGVSQTLTYTVNPDASTNYPGITSPFLIGEQYFGWNLDGQVDEFRVSKGVARWTSNFTPPTEPYTSDSYTKLLLHFDTDYTDSGNTGHTVASTNTSIVQGYFSTDTDFYMYYGNTEATDGQDATNVWDSNYLFVSHMTDVTDSTIKNSKDGTSKNKLSSDNPLQSDGLNYKAQDFSADDINLGDIDIVGDGTIEAIINPDSFPSTYGNAVVSKGDAGGNSSYADLGLILSQTSGYVNIQTGDTSTYQSFVSTLQAIAGSWQYIAGRTDGSNLSAFLDTTKQTQAQTTTPAGNANNYRIGRFGDYAGLQYDGRIGEVRLSSNARTDAWLKATRQTLFDNLLTFGSEEEQPTANVDGTITFTDIWTIQTNPAQALMDETITLDDEWIIDTSPKQEAINGTISLDDAWTVLLQQKAYYATEIISANSLIFITDTSPARILHIDITDPENPVIDGADLLSVTNAQSVTFDSNTDSLYVACADGKVVKVDINNLATQTIIDLSDTDELVTISNLNNYSLIYTSTDNTVGELYQIDERLTTVLNTNFYYLLGYYVPMKANFNFIEAKSLDTNFYYLSEVSTGLKTDFKWVASTVPDPIDRDDIIVTVNGVDLTDKDVRLDSIVITHIIDDKSQAVFTVARRHDNIDETMDGFASVLTNNNDIVITINGHVEFTGKVYSLDCQYNIDSELINVTATGTQQSPDSKKISLSLPSLNQDISLYDLLLQSPSIYNPHIDANEENPEIYKGIKVDLGERREEKLFRGRYIETTPASQFQGNNAKKIDEGSFDFDNNSTYFWQVEALNYVNAVSWGSPTYKYIGTSLGSVSSDTWYLKGIAYWRQKIFDEDIKTMGFYTVGEAPYQEISVKNGRFITKKKYADRPDGFYTVQDEGYNYVGNVQDYDHDGQYTTITKGFTQIVADLEYEKLQNINGDVLPITSASMQVTIDAYYYYAMKLLTRINVDNTTKANIYNNNNGFPVSIKTIIIDTNTMSVTLSTDNTKSQTELEEIDARYPNEEDYIVDSYEALVTPKYRLPTSQISTRGAGFNFLPSKFWDT